MNHTYLIGLDVHAKSTSIAYAGDPTAASSPTGPAPPPARTRRRHLLALGIDPKRVHLATRSRKGYCRMSQNEGVRHALNNRWLEEQGVPDLRSIWIVLHYGPQARV